MTNRILILSAFLLLTIIMCNGVSAAENNNSTDIDAQIMNVNVPFVENQGQNDEEVSYYAKTFYGTSYVTQDGVTHQIQGKNNTTLVLKEQFRDSDGNPIKFQAKGEEPSNTTVSYFKGNDPNNWHTNLQTYNLINLGEIYPGIVIKLRATGSNIEKLFFISPGANPDNIRIQILGADQLQTDEKGNLNIKSTGFEQVSMSPPKAYQDKNDVEVKYQTTGNTYQFQIGNYNQNQELIIDPALEYSTYLGGTNSEFSLSIAVDNSGSAYITGYTYSTNFPTTPGAYQTTNAGSWDAFVTKLNPTGTDLIYSTYLGGTEDDYGVGIALDNSGSAYITGYTYSNNFPTTPDAYQTTNAGNYDVFVTKLNPTGTALQYSTYLGGTSTEYGVGVAVDNSGSAHITGYTYSNNFPTTPGAYQTTNNSNYDAFVTKLNPTGTDLIYSTYLGGSGPDDGVGIAVDNSGSAYIAGYTYSNNFPTTPDAYQTTNNGNADAFVTKLNSNGTDLIYSTYLGGTDNDYGVRIALDNSGSAHITGYTHSTNFPTTPGAYQTTNNGYVDAFITKLNPTGTDLIYSTYLGGTDDDVGMGVALDNSGSAHITGYTYSTNFPTTPGAYQTINNGNADAFVTKLNPTGTALQYSTYLGGNGPDDGVGIAVDNTGSAYIAGYTTSTNFPTTPGAYQTTNNGNTDAFVAKFKSAADLSIEKTVNNTAPYVEDTVIYTIIVRNNGPDTSFGVTVSDILPEGMAYVSSSANYGTYDPVTGIWSIYYLPNQAVAILTITSTVLRAGDITNTARVTALTYDPIIDDTTATTTINAQERPTPVPPTPVNGKTVPMQKTGTTLAVLALAVLMVLGGIVYTKK
ncbi:MAG: SBBP repeat-containing protein [Methanomicrobiales archaeon]